MNEKFLIFGKYDNFSTLVKTILNICVFTNVKSIVILLNYSINIYAFILVIMTCLLKESFI